MNNGWIALHRKLLDWEWWDDHNTTRLFLYLLLKANHEDKRWKGVEIKRGQLITGLHSLKKGTGISVRSLRTSLKRLESTNEIARKTTNKYSLITINRYDHYQDRNYEATSKTTSKLTSKRQASDKQATTNNNYNNVTTKQINNNNAQKFNEFWSKYPRKISKKKSQQKYFNILKTQNKDEDIHADIMKGLENYLPKWKKTETKFIPHPTTWLNGERWNDQVGESKKKFESETSKPYENIF